MSADTRFRAINADPTPMMEDTTATSADACAAVKLHQANPVPRVSVAVRKAVNVAATATGCFFVSGQKCVMIAVRKAMDAATSAVTREI